jgi:peptide/nickel transport system substrate-binding protein
LPRIGTSDTSVTFKLHKGATFHDGTPITAGFPTFQMKAGSLERPEQFVVINDHRLRVDFVRIGAASSSKRSCR